MCEAPISKWEQERTPGLYKETLSIKLGCICGVDPGGGRRRNGSVYDQVILYAYMKFSKD